MEGDRPKRSRNDRQRTGRQGAAAARKAVAKRAPPKSVADIRTEVAHLMVAATAVFENADHLFQEAVLLTKGTYWPRALVLHQISLEELAKLDLIGGYIAQVLMGAGNSSRFYIEVRQHEAKNKVNAYFQEMSEEERAAARRGDVKRQLEIFQQVQDDFHKASNDDKNAGLYVNISKDAVTTPDASIDEKKVAVIAERNAKYMHIGQQRLDWLQNMTADVDKAAREMKSFMEKAEELRKNKSLSPDEARLEMFKIAIEVRFGPQDDKGESKQRT